MTSLISFMATFLLVFSPISNGLDVRYFQIPKSALRYSSSTLVNGTSYIFRSNLDKSVITVHPNGDVTTEKFANSPEQKWKVVPHPTDSNALEFKQEVVPYNTLSGFENPPDNPGIFPRPLGLAIRGKVENVDTFNILIRGRWCIQANGLGYPMDMDDCESFVAPWQLWELEKAS